VQNFFAGAAMGAGTVVATSAAVASGTLSGAAAAVAAVGVGSFYATASLSEVVTGEDCWTFAPLSAEQRVDRFAGLLGAFVGGGLAGSGREVRFGPNFRIAPFGNRTGNRLGELPHYHRGGIDPTTGETLQGQGIGRHRPWEKKATDDCAKDRF
jgi:hypothetical protein